MKTIKELELSLIVKEARIQQLNFKVEQLKDYLWRVEEAILDYSMNYKNNLNKDDLLDMIDEVDFVVRQWRKRADKE